MTPLEPLVRITSTATPLPVDSIDTDVITPMNRVMDGTFVERAFEALRTNPDGSRKPNPFDEEQYADDQILITGANFGCGSSRETAVWAIKGMGYRVVIAEGFGDIFYANCFKNGLLPIVLAPQDIRDLFEAAAARMPITVDVATATLRYAGQTRTFELPDLRRTALLEGLDDLDLALRMDAAIAKFEADDRTKRPWAQTSSPPTLSA